jgi:hypothetical protein
MGSVTWPLGNLATLATWQSGNLASPAPSRSYRADALSTWTHTGLTKRSCSRLEVGENRDSGCDSNQSVSGVLTALPRDKSGDNDTATREKQHKPTTCGCQLQARWDAEMRRCHAMKRGRTHRPCVAGCCWTSHRVHRIVSQTNMRNKMLTDV